VCLQTRARSAFHGPLATVEIELENPLSILLVVLPDTLFFQPSSRL
jgi:hypothetical protein